MKPKKRFAVNAKVRVVTPGIDGIVTQLDDTPTVLWEYWHTIQTEHGERREPGSNLELIPAPKTQSPGRGLPHQIHMHGPNARVNLYSTDNSTNTSSVSGDQLFIQLRETVGSVEEGDRADILARIDALEHAEGSNAFLVAYQNFIASVADYITIFSPFIPALAQRLSGR